MTESPTTLNASASCMRDDGAPVPATHRLIELFWKISPAFTRWTESHMNDPRFTPQRVRVLIHLKERGSVKMSDLRDALGVTATNVTALVDALEKDLLVERSDHPTDRRATMVNITEYARNLMHEHCGEFKERVSQLFKDFSPEQAEQLVTLLTHVRGALIERGVLEPIHYAPDVVKEKEES